MWLSKRRCCEPASTSVGTVTWRGRTFQLTRLMRICIALGAAALVITAIATVRTVLNHDNSGRRCDDLLRNGRWSFAYNHANRAQWQAFGSVLHSYDQASTSTCLGNRTLYFIGDSTIRQVFWATAVKLGGFGAYRASAEARKHESLSYQSNNASLSFVWDPYLNSSEATGILDLLQADPRRAAVFVSTGLWHARYGGETFMNEYNDSMRRAVQNIPPQNKNSSGWISTKSWLDQTPVIAVPPPHLNHEWLNPERASTLTRTRLSHVTSQLARVEAFSGLEVAWAAREMTHDNPAAILEGGLHVTRAVAVHQAELLLNRLCNKNFSGTLAAYSRPCVSTEHAKWSWPILLGFALVTCGRYRRISLDQSGYRSQAPLSIFAITFSCWLADRTLVFDKSKKLVSEELFVLAAFASVLLGLVRMERIPIQTMLPHTKNGCVESTTEILPRAQTEEWKGWMQVVILLYHYFGMSSVLWVYQFLRVLVASYLFLTGYGHAMYFQKTSNFSFKRVVMVLTRLNLLACFLAVVMNNHYDFYYFPGLASLWFLVTYATFWRSKGRRLTLGETLTRIGMSILATSVVLRSEKPLSTILQALQIVFGPKINSKEFLFRVKLDIFAPYFGMVFSVVQHRNIVNHITWRPRQKFQKLQKLLPALVTLMAFTLVIAYMLIARQFRDKYIYNEYHSSLSILPISAYIMFRNVLQASRRYYASIFASIGSFSLELFVLQYHIWLAADTKALLRLGWIDVPRFAPAGKSVAGSWTFWVESAVITLVFFCLSNHCATATNALVKWFVGANDRTLLIRTGVVLAILWIFNVLAWIDGR